jgi:hypothetical protein
MRRLIIVAVMAALTLGLTPTALAGAPYREHGTTTQSFVFPAGEVCDFEYAESWVAKENYFEFGDPATDGYILYKAQSRVVHTNLDTGYALTETTTIVEKFYPGTMVDKVVGVFWHLRDADGRLVMVHAGQWIIDYSGDLPVVVKITPNMLDAVWSEVICTALGGNSA